MIKLTKNSKKLLKKLYLLLGVVMIAHLPSNNMEAIQITTKFYEANNIPEEYQHIKDGGNLTIMLVEGCPKNSPISIFEKRLTERNTKQLNTLNPQEAGAFIHAVSSLGYLPGEYTTYTFKNSKSKINKEIEVIPNPIYAKSSKDQARVEAKLRMMNPTSYWIVLTGFKPGEELVFKSCCYDECLEHKITFLQTNCINYMPEVVNKKGGIAHLSIKRASGEILQLELPWGLEGTKYFLYYDKDKNVKSILEDKDFSKDFPEAAKYFNSKL